MTEKKLTDEFKTSVQIMSLESMRTYILLEMRTQSTLSREAAEYLIESYENRLSELYW